MKKKPRDRRHWLEEAERRQQNTVFPNAYHNLGGFWRNLSEKESLSISQWLGLIVIFLAYLSFLVYGIWVKWPAGPEPWWQKVVYGYSFYFVLWVVIVAGVCITSRRADKRRK